MLLEINVYYLAPFTDIYNQQPENMTINISFEELILPGGQNSISILLLLDSDCNYTLDYQHLCFPNLENIGVFEVRLAWIFFKLGKTS